MAKDTKKKSETKNKGGRPSKFKALNLKKVKQLATRGWTDREMSEFFDVSYATWNNWKGKHPKFLDSLKEWKTEADERVERALYERALGFSHDEDKIFCSKEGLVTTVATVKTYAPDTTAAIFWLKNRQPKHWKDSKNINISHEEHALKLAEHLKKKDPKLYEAVVEALNELEEML
jgi:hypothetical protein